MQVDPLGDKAMNFSTQTVQQAIRYVNAIKLQTKHHALGLTNQRRAYNAAVTFGGMHPEETNALARIAGHPFAPDLPGWMLGIDVQLVAPHGGETVRVSFGSRDYERLARDGWTQTIREEL